MLSKYQYRTNAVLMLSNEGREQRVKNVFPYIGYLLGPRGAAGAGGGAVLNIHEAAWFSRALF